MIPDMQAFLAEKRPDFSHLDADTKPFGTFGYMSPEQKDGHISPQTDIYSLGVTMYELVTGNGPTTLDGLRQLANHVPPGQENPFIPSWLNNVIVQAIQPDPAYRFQSVTRMIEIFEKNRNQRPSSTLSSSTSVSNVNNQHVIGQFNNVVTSLQTTSQTELATTLKLFKEAVVASMAISPNKKQELLEIINRIGEEASNW